MTDLTADPVVAAESLAHSIATDAYRILNMARDPKTRRNIPVDLIWDAHRRLDEALTEMHKND